MNIFYRLFEILFIIVLPLLLFYLRSKWPQKGIIIYSIVLPLLWYLFYAPFHELSHILGCGIVGAKINDYRLFTHFWEGSFGFAYVNVKGGFDESVSSLIILVSPYVLDLFSILLGYYVLSRFKTKNSFLAGLILIFLCLRPIYDLVDNYLGIIYNHSDFVLIIKIIGEFITYCFGIITVGLGIFVIIKILQKYYSYPLFAFKIEKITIK